MATRAGPRNIAQIQPTTRDQLNRAAGNFDELLLLRMLLLFRFLLFLLLLSVRRSLLMWLRAPGRATSAEATVGRTWGHACFGSLCHHLHRARCTWY